MTVICNRQVTHPGKIAAFFDDFIQYMNGGDIIDLYFIKSARLILKNKGEISEK